MEVMMRKAFYGLVIAGIAAGGLALVQARDKVAEPEVRPVGEPRNCVTTHQIRSTKVIDERTIDFKMADGKTYRNVMAYSCPGLKFEERFLYKTSTSQLCNVDIIRVLNDYGGRLREGAGCGLGKFQQIERVTPAS
jgi:hypothetical protein